jgi:hypothetical protein
MIYCSNVDYQFILYLRGLNNWEYLCSKTVLHRNIFKGIKKIRLKSDVRDMSL